ncbi:MAG: DNA-directed RNA polymerase subunit M [bacterium]|nr:DNA-directed RNA polymerase subunit M [bacterium]
MLKVYICPQCGWMRTVSRRSDVECFKCNAPQMELTRLTYEKYTQMSETEREDYAARWKYLHK